MVGILKAKVGEILGVQAVAGGGTQGKDNFDLGSIVIGGNCQSYCDGD